MVASRRYFHHAFYRKKIVFSFCIKIPYFDSFKEYFNLKKNWEKKMLQFFNTYVKRKMCCLNFAIYLKFELLSKSTKNFDYFCIKHGNETTIYIMNLIIGHQIRSQEQKHIFQCKKQSIRYKNIR